MVMGNESVLESVQLCDGDCAVNSNCATAQLCDNLKRQVLLKLDLMGVAMAMDAHAATEC